MRLRESDMPREGEWESYFRPKETLSRLGLRRGMVLADLGCGYGTFALAGAEIAGRAGLVYAVDLNRRMVRRIAARSLMKGLGNVRALRGDITSLKRSGLPDRGVDFALLANVVHGTGAKVRLLKGVAGILRPRGRIAILNWNLSKTPRGPPMKMRPAPESITKCLLRAGYKNVKFRDIPPHHHALVALRPHAAGP